jgi:hypothetical protein
MLTCGGPAQRSPVQAALPDLGDDTEALLNAATVAERQERAEVAFTQRKRHLHSVRHRLLSLVLTAAPPGGVEVTGDAVVTLTFSGFACNFQVAVRWLDSAARQRVAAELQRPELVAGPEIAEVPAG